MNDNNLLKNVNKIEFNITTISTLHNECGEVLNTNNSRCFIEIKDALNDIFKNQQCTEVSYTNNFDNIFFGIHINPVITASDAISILCTEDPVNIKKYQLELDSKLFELELNSIELVSIILYEISSLFDYNTIDKVRSIVDNYILHNDDIINIRESVNYSQLIIYALKDTMHKESSIMFKDSSFLENALIHDAGLDSPLSTAYNTINSLISNDTSTRIPKIIILQWVFHIYKDMMHNSIIAKETLKEAKEFTGSRLEKIEIDKTIKAIDKINDESLIENVSLNKLFESKCLYSLNETSLFKSLKQNGLRGIEDNLYEYSMRIKNVETEEDAIYILRCINTRLNILEDYLYTTNNLSDAERKHWESVALKYRLLRDELSKKKIWKQKTYGLFFDYNQTFEEDE